MPRTGTAQASLAIFNCLGLCGVSRKNGKSNHSSSEKDQIHRTFNSRSGRNIQAGFGVDQEMTLL